VAEFALDDAGDHSRYEWGQRHSKHSSTRWNRNWLRVIDWKSCDEVSLETHDTIYGARVYFSNANSSPDMIRISLLNGDPSSCIPGDTVAQQQVQSTILDQRKGGFFNQFWPYYFPKPIVLSGRSDNGPNRGVYWIRCESARSGQLPEWRRCLQRRRNRQDSRCIQSTDNNQCMPVDMGLNTDRDLAKIMECGVASGPFSHPMVMDGFRGCRSQAFGPR